MKMSFLLIPLLVVISGCGGPEWIKAGGNKDVAYYFHNAPRTNAYGRVVTWELVDFNTKQHKFPGLTSNAAKYRKAGEGFKSVMVQYEYDCSRELRNLKWVQVYSGNMGKGELLDEGTLPESYNRWDPVTPGKVDESVLISVCYAKAQPVVSTNAQNNDLMNLLIWSSLLHSHY